MIALLLGFLLLDRSSREKVYDLSGKTVLITGGSRGLGLVMARQLLDANARVAICARDEAESRNLPGSVLVDSLPLISASAEQVARATIAGLHRSAAEVIVTLQPGSAAQRNNERPVVEPKTTTVVKQVGSDVN